MSRISYFMIRCLCSLQFFSMLNLSVITLQFRVFPIFVTAIIVALKVMSDVTLQYSASLNYNFGT